MLPDPRQVGEPQIDHLDLLVLDRLQEIFGCRTIRNHGFFTPATLERRLKIVLPFSRCHAAPDRFWYTFQLGAAAASIRHGGAHSGSPRHTRAGSFSSGAARA
jgi:hypothetical protein